MYAIPSLEFPNELLDGDRVVIVDASRENKAQVRDSGGTSYTVPLAVLDCGFEFEIAADEWRHESDPIVITMIRAEVAKINELKEDVDISPQSLEELTEQNARILVRHADQPKRWE